MEKEREPRGGAKKPMLMGMGVDRMKCKMMPCFAVV